MTLIPQWRLWWKRWSTWLLGLIPIITAARDFAPTLQEWIPIDIYKLLMIILSVGAFVAIQIKQRSVSIPPLCPTPAEVKTDEPV